jgi:hypothetical protein
MFEMFISCDIGAPDGTTAGCIEPRARKYVLAGRELSESGAP